MGLTQSSTLLREGREKMEKGHFFKDQGDWISARSHFEKVEEMCEEYDGIFDMDNEDILELLNTAKRQIQSVNDKERNENRRYQIHHNQQIDEGNQIIVQSLHSQIRISNWEVGHTYESIFGPYVNNSCYEVIIKDPYIQKQFQITLFLRFCEMLVKHSSDSLESIQLITRMYNDDTELQKSRFMEIKASLAQRGIEFYFVFSNTLHDREFYLDNGWLIKIGRGLDFYQSTQGQFQIGGMDLSMRPCMETTVDIFQCRI